ncbi:MAG: endonuclease/exonuclease/phosphatase family protein [Anaerolineae bacterium]|nr:endonuclease/exonuclease/phosphatase family protein [Anaerolineae bacterium]
MQTIKLTSWNIAHLERLVEENPSSIEITRRDAVVAEIRSLNPDVLCLVEGPRGEAAIDAFCEQYLQGQWKAIKAPDGEYSTSGTQWIWFLVRDTLAPHASLLPTETWDAFTSKSWEVHYWGQFDSDLHRHYRHPQVLVLDWHGLRVECIGLHLKSKFVNSGASLWKAGGEKQQEFIQSALKARVKMTTEAANVRAYIDAKFAQVEKPAIFVMGDLNDGPGKEYFEERYLFFDLISNIQGDIFAATRFLNHALFDFPDHLRWTVDFKDFVDPDRPTHILLDHILFTQGLCDGSLSWQVNAHAGLVEHEIHDLINAPLSSKAKTSDHKPVSLLVAAQSPANS